MLCIRNSLAPTVSRDERDGWDRFGEASGASLSPFLFNSAGIQQP